MGFLLAQVAVMFKFLGALIGPAEGPEGGRFRVPMLHRGFAEGETNLSSSANRNAFLTVLLVVGPRPVGCRAPRRSPANDLRASFGTDIRTNNDSAANVDGSVDTELGET